MPHSTRHPPIQHISANLTEADSSSCGAGDSATDPTLVGTTQLVPSCAGLMRSSQTKPQCHPAQANCQGLRSDRVSSSDHCTVHAGSCIHEFHGGLAVVCVQLAHCCCVGRRLYQAGKPLTLYEGHCTPLLGLGLPSVTNSWSFPPVLGFLSGDHNSASAEGTMRCPLMSSGASCRQACWWSLRPVHDRPAGEQFQQSTAKQKECALNSICSLEPGYVLTLTIGDEPGHV